MNGRFWVYVSSVGVNVITLVIGIVSGVLTARLLTVEERGALGVLTYYPAIVGSLFSLGLPHAISIKIASLRGNVDAFRSAGLALSLFFGIVGSAFFAAIAFHTLRSDQIWLSDDIYVLCLLSLPMVVNPAMYAIHRAEQRVNWVNAMLIFAAVAYLGLVLILWKFSTLDAFSLALYGMGLQWTIAVANIARLPNFKPWNDLQPAVLWECASASFRLFIPLSIGMIYGLADRALLIQLASLEELAYYTIAMSVAFPLSLVVEPIAQYGMLEVASAENRSRAKEVLVLRFHMAQVISLSCGVPLLIASPYIVRYAFGLQYVEAESLAQLAVVAMMLRAINKAFDYGTKGLNAIAPGIFGSATALLVLVLVSALLVPTKGAAGLILALVAAEIAALAASFSSLRRSIDLPVAALWGCRPSVLRLLTSAVIHRIVARFGPKKCP